MRHIQSLSPADLCCLWPSLYITDEEKAESFGPDESQVLKRALPIKDRLGPCHLLLFMEQVWLPLRWVPPPRRLVPHYCQYLLTVLVSQEEVHC